MRESQLTFLEFFAGGGMARAGLGESWRCLFANDFDAMKVAAYARNYGDADIKLEDVAKLTLDDLPCSTERPRVGVLSMPGPFARGRLCRSRPGT